MRSRAPQWSTQKRTFQIPHSSFHTAHMCDKHIAKHGNCRQSPSLIVLSPFIMINSAKSQIYLVFCVKIFYVYLFSRTNYGPRNRFEVLAIFFLKFKCKAIILVMSRSFNLTTFTHTNLFTFTLMHHY